MLPDKIYEAALVLWKYHHLNHKLEPCDCILVLGSHDLRVAEEGARLYLAGFAPLIVFSGGLGNLTSTIWKVPEADQFAEIALKMGVPPTTIMVENKSTNTGENIRFTEKLLAENKLHPQSLILVQKPYMERRTYATTRIYWPEKKLLVTSPQLSFDQYHTAEIPIEKVISIMVGDLERIRYYPDKGFQIHQDIPGNVWQAWELLVDAGYNAHRMPSA